MCYAANFLRGPAFEVFESYLTAYLTTFWLELLDPVRAVLDNTENYLNLLVRLFENF